LTEETPQAPINPYGESKLAIERALHWYGKAHGLRWVALRYFNAAGADPDGGLGEAHEPEPHLIPCVFRAALGQEPCIQVFGTDYPTPDGTAIRDYIHVTDLAEAHLASLHYLQEGGESRALNLGVGRGHSVRQVIDAAARISGRQVPRVDRPRREGDPPVLVADAALARRVLGWHPSLSSLDVILETAWRWHNRPR
jgi:UDP-arabinose 4-epimerase